MLMTERSLVTRANWILRANGPVTNPMQAQHKKQPSKAGLRSINLTALRRQVGPYRLDLYDPLAPRPTVHRSTHRLR